MLYSKVNQLYVYIYPSFLNFLLIYITTEHWVEFPVLYGRFLYVQLKTDETLKVEHVFAFPDHMLDLIMLYLKVWLQVWPSFVYISVLSHNSLPLACFSSTRNNIRFILHPYCLAWCGTHAQKMLVELHQLITNVIHYCNYFISTVHKMYLCHAMTKMLIFPDIV